MAFIAFMTDKDCQRVLRLLKLKHQFPKIMADLDEKKHYSTISALKTMKLYYLTVAEAAPGQWCPVAHQVHERKVVKDIYRENASQRECFLWREDQASHDSDVSSFWTKHSPKHSRGILLLNLRTEGILQPTIYPTLLLFDALNPLGMPRRCRPWRRDRPVLPCDQSSKSPCLSLCPTRLAGSQAEKASALVSPTMTMFWRPAKT